MQRRVVLFDGAAPAGQGEHLVIAQHQPPPPCGGHRATAEAAVVALQHQLHGLLAGMAAEDRRESLPQLRFEHQPFIGDHLPLHHGLAKAPGAVDQHAGAAPVGPHQSLHTDRQADGEVIETEATAIHDGAVAEQRGVAASAGPQQGLVTADRQDRLLLPGKAGLG